MRILIEPSRDKADIQAASAEVRRGLEILNAANIRTDGGGTIESDGVFIGAIVLHNTADMPRALEVLAEAGIKASSD